VTIAKNLGLLAPQVSSSGTISYNSLTNLPQVISLKCSSLVYPGNDLAADPAGGQTISIIGTGFEATPTVYVGGTIASSVTFVSSTQINFVTPAKTAGTYDIYVVNPGGATAIFVFGISYSGVPNWTTAAGSLGTFDSALNIQLQATSNSAVTYALATGSTLPSGVTLSSSGLLSGMPDTDQAFSFTVVATDLENQDTSRSFQTTVSIADPYFKYVTLLLSGNGTNTAQNNTFVDSSTNNFTIARSGNTTQGTFSPYGTLWSNYFDGDGDRLSISNNSALDLTGDFALECWVNSTKPYTAYTIQYVHLFGKNSGNSTGGYSVGVYGQKLTLSAEGTVISGSTNLLANNWYHVAVTRSGTTLRLFVNGVLDSTTTGFANNLTNSEDFTIGDRVDGSPFAQYPFQGYISNVRVVKGTAVYTSNFVPSTTPLTAIANTSLLTCQSNRFRDASSNNFVVTPSGQASVQRFSPFSSSTAYSASTDGGSGYFDGSGDYLEAQASSSYANNGSTNMTIEFWAYATTAGYYYLQDQNANGAAIAINFSPTGGYIYWYGGPSIGYLTATPTNLNIPARAWNHFAFVRNGSTCTVYVNGQNIQSGTNNSAFGQNALLTIGRYGGGGYEFPGYISNYRYVNGTAVYTSNFTPPTAPLTAITNTNLLLNFTNAGIVDNAEMNVLETVGNAQISTAQAKYGTGSLYFNAGSANTDYLRTPPGSSFYFGGDFTIEMWIYPLSLSTAYSADSYSPIIDNDASAGPNSNTWFVLHQQDQTIYFATVGGNTSMQTGNVITAANQWYHLAVTRTGSTMRIFVNGTQEASTTFSSALGEVGRRTYITTQPGNSRWWKGYIDDLRITNGYARYTANFTPPTSAHKLK